MPPPEPENGSLLWCAGCRYAFFAVGNRARVRERARACGWVEDRAGHWCDECRPGAGRRRRERWDDDRG